jgi:hypothetical protein
MIGACDICDAQNVPIMKGVTFGCEIASCYPCQGQPIPEDETMTTEIDRYRELLRRTDIVLSMLLLEIADKDMAKEARALLSAIDVETHTGASPEMTPLIERGNGWVKIHYRRATAPSAGITESRR